MFIFRDLIAEDTILPKPGPHLEARSLYVCTVAAVVADYCPLDSEYKLAGVNSVYLHHGHRQQIQPYLRT